MTLIYPVDIKKYPITQKFGNKLYITDPKSPLYIPGKEDYYARYGLNGHDGEDQGCPIGTKAVFSHDGKVINIGYDPTGYGKYIREENDVEGTIYGHLSEITVIVGQTVKQGDQMGFTGNSGGSTGPHIHRGYYRKPRNRSNGFDGYIDPISYLLAEGATMEITNLNTWGLDDTNLDSKQVVYNTWHDVASGKYVEIAKYNTLLESDTKKQLDLQDLQKLFDEKFAILGQIQDMGFKTVSDVKAVVSLYNDMAMADYPDLDHIKAVITAKDEQITHLTQALQAATPAAQENIELAAKVEDLSIKTARVRSDSLYNTLAQWLERAKVLFKGNKKAEAIIATVEEIKPEQVENVIQSANSWAEYYKSLGINK